MDRMNTGRGLPFSDPDGMIPRFFFLIKNEHVVVVVQQIGCRYYLRLRIGWVAALRLIDRCVWVLAVFTNPLRLAIYTNPFINQRRTALSIGSRRALVYNEYVSISTDCLYYYYHHYGDMHRISDRATPVGRGFRIKCRPLVWITGPTGLQQCFQGIPVCGMMRSSRVRCPPLTPSFINFSTSVIFANDFQSVTSSQRRIENEYLAAGGRGRYIHRHPFRRRDIHFILLISFHNLNLRLDTHIYRRYCSVVQVAKSEFRPQLLYYYFFLLHIKVDRPTDRPTNR